MPISSTLLALLSCIASSHAFHTLDSYYTRKNLKETRKCSTFKATTEKSWEVIDDWNQLYQSDREYDLTNLNPFSQNDTPDVKEESKQDQFISDTIDFINHYLNPNDPQLYDTTTTQDNTETSERDMDEIAMMIRCNKSPDDLLIQEGRALGELLDEEKFDLQQLVMKTEQDSSSVIMLHNERYEPTDYFDQTVYAIFSTYAEEENGIDVINSKSMAKWLGTCLNESIAKHSKQILTLISKYGTYGKGYLTQQNFYNMYIDALKQAVKESFANQDKTLRNIWRDFYNHDMLSPSHKMYLAMERDMEEQIGAIRDKNREVLMDDFVDECEILDWGLDDSKELKSSYELVEMASDNKTPKRIRDGDFVFVDEESCIGCMQCVQIAPTSYTMLEDGRARAFHQNNSPEVSTAVSVCPVNCIHKISFHELKELEVGRDQGDGHGHHKHMGRRQGHTPLFVAGIDSDANHKSSWYHYMKQKCCSSGACPSRGCFDCPRFSQPGDNPFFKELDGEARYVRKLDFALNSWEVQMKRKFANV